MAIDVTASISTADLEALRPGDHLCWIVEDASTYVDQARCFLAEAALFRQKPVVFGPEGSPERDRLAAFGAMAADPWRHVLGMGSLAPEKMFEMFRGETVRARADGFDGVRLMADMDWLLPASPTAEAVVGFEVALDRVVRELDATIVCAYRPGSFDDGPIDGTLCVHPRWCGSTTSPQFQLVAFDATMWQLSGDVDLAVAPVFEAAIRSALEVERCALDASGLEFIDVAGARALAVAAARRQSRLTVVGLCGVAKRMWESSGFAAATASFVATN